MALFNKKKTENDAGSADVIDFAAGSGTDVSGGVSTGGGDAGGAGVSNTVSGLSGRNVSTESTMTATDRADFWASEDDTEGSRKSKRRSKSGKSSISLYKPKKAQGARGGKGTGSQGGRKLPGIGGRFRPGKRGSDHGGDQASFSAGSAAAAALEKDDDAFNVNVRFSEPILQVSTGEDGAQWKKDLPFNIAGGLLIMSFVSVFCLTVYEPGLVLCALPALIVFAALTTLDSFDKSSIKYLACGVIALLLLLIALIFRTRVFGGLAYLMNSFYDEAELAQSYIYQRIGLGMSAAYTDTRIGILWLSTLLGTLGALLPPAARRICGMIASAVFMIVIAYYGLAPSWVGIAMMLLALLLTMPRDNMLAALPLLLAAIIVFGTVIAIDPGESYAVSRLNENVRDKIAFHSALLRQEMQDMQNTFNDITFNDPQDYDDITDDPESIESRNAVKWILIILVIAAVGAAVYFLVRRFLRRREEVRRGIDSTDPREAVTAMFPYSVRWLKASGTDPGTAPFSAMTERLKARYTADYSQKFYEMYKLWREAAYSDHEISEQDRTLMDRFMNNTMELAAQDWNPFQKAVAVLKNAL